MGVAEITPGISGATIAGLFNVYKGFISFLNSINPIKLNSGIKLFFKEIDINFIAPLLIGMSISIYLSAFAIDYLMSTYLFFFKLFLSFVMAIAVIKNCFFDQSFEESRSYLLTFTSGIFIALIIALSIIQLDFNNFVLLLISKSPSDPAYKFSVTTCEITVIIKNIKIFFINAVYIISSTYLKI